MKCCSVNFVMLNLHMQKILMHICVSMLAKHC